MSTTIHSHPNPLFHLSQPNILWKTLNILPYRHMAWNYGKCILVKRCSVTQWQQFPLFSYCIYFFMASAFYYLIVCLQTCFTFFSPFHSSLNSADGSPSSWSSRCLSGPLSSRSLSRPSFSGSVWCVSLWSFCATVHPVDRKHPVHHHSQLPVGSAGSVAHLCDLLPDNWGLAPHDPSLSKPFARRKS